MMFCHPICMMSCVFVLLFIPNINSIKNTILTLRIYNSLLPLDPEVEKQVRASSVLHECQQLVGCPFLCYLHKIVISHEPLLYSITLGSSWNWNSVHPCELHIWAFGNSYIMTCKWASVLQSWAMKGLGFLHIYSPVQSSILSVTRNHLQQGGVRFPLVVPNPNKSSLYPLCVPQTLFPKDPPSHTLWLRPSDQNASPCLYTEGSIWSHQPLTPEDCEDYNKNFIAVDWKLAA